MLNLAWFPLGWGSRRAHPLGGPQKPEEDMTDAPSSLRKRAIFMLLLATFYWGVSFPLTKSIMSMNKAILPGAGTWYISTLAVAPRFLIAALLMLVFRRRGDRPATRLEVRQGMVIGGFNAAGAFLQADGLQYTDASTSAFLTQLTAILIPAWLALRSRRSPGAIIWLGCVLVLAGVAILGHFDWRTLRFGRGEWETLLCSLFFMGQILWLERPEFAGNRPGRVTLAMFSMQASVFVALAAVTTPSVHALIAPWESPVWLGLTLVLAVVCTIGAFSIMNKWQPRITSTEAGLVYCVEPLFASIFALFLPGIFSVWAAIDYPDERATWALAIGGGLITVANVLVQMAPPPPKFRSSRAIE
jgi:drug/metabolite transporter (DMT)-like permease